MTHSVTSGNCARGGGGGGGYGGYGGGGDDCTDAHTWTDDGPSGRGLHLLAHVRVGGQLRLLLRRCTELDDRQRSSCSRPQAAGPCTPGDHTLCLNGGRFAVTAHWTKTDGSNGDGTVVGLTDDSGYFWFFDSANIEVTVKVLDACAINGAHWVFAAGLTNVQVDLKVVDTSTGVTYDEAESSGLGVRPDPGHRRLPVLLFVAVAWTGRERGRPRPRKNPAGEGGKAR